MRNIQRFISPVLRPGFFCAAIVWLDPEAIGWDAGMFLYDPGSLPRDRLFAEGGADCPFGESALVADKLVGILQILRICGGGSWKA